MSDGESLGDAGRVAPLVAGDRIRLARELQRWTQQQLVAATDDALTAAALSQLETGQTRPPPAPSPRSLTRRTVHLPSSWLAHRTARRPASSAVSAPPRPVIAASTSHGRGSSTTSSAPWRNTWRYPTSIYPGTNCPLDIRTRLSGSPNVCAPTGISVTSQSGTSFAPSSVAASSWCASADFTREIDAFSVCFGERPVVVLGSEKAVTARSRFDAAHELGHLVLHSDDEAGTKDAERQAHEFAAAFLMPSSAIRDQLPARADWQTLMRLKTTWRVSIQALLRRALTLEVMSKQQYVSAMKAVSARAGGQQSLATRN